MNATYEIITLLHDSSTTIVPTVANDATPVNGFVGRIATLH